MTLLSVLAVSALAVPAAPAQVTTCDVLPVTISGTSGADHITGTPGNEVIAAGAGNDTLVVRNAVVRSTLFGG